MGESLKKNFVYNLVNVITGLLFPLITFPYASRILMPSGIGQIQFFQSIINYIALFTALGIPLYAVKEIAKVRDNLAERNKTTVEILVLYLLLTVIGYLAVGVICLFVNKVHAGLNVFLLLSSHLLLTALGAEWFYQGIEEFKYITIRSLAVRFVSLVCLFIFVKEESDLLIYAILIVLAEAGNNLFNFIHLRKYVCFKDCVSGLNISRHLKPALKIFALNVIVSIYTNLDSVMLGFMSSNEAVGYYSAATKLTRALMGFATALGGVLLPYLANEYSKGNYDAYRTLTNKAVSFMLILYLPLSIGLFMTAPQLIPLFCGNAYMPSIMTLQILAPLTLFLSISGILGTRVLYAQNLENIVILSTAIGASLNFILNLILIPRLDQNGAAIASVIAEFFVTFSMLLLSRRYIRIYLFTKQNLFVLLCSAIMWLPIIFIQYSNLSNWAKFVVEVFSAVVVYLSLLLATKNEVLFSMISFTGLRIGNKNNKN